jgi:hypothetical protein
MSRRSELSRLASWWASWRAYHPWVASWWASHHQIHHQNLQHQVQLRSRSVEESLCQHAMAQLETLSGLRFDFALAQLPALTLFSLRLQFVAAS